jgi:hypothetical protein
VGYEKDEHGNTSVTYRLHNNAGTFINGGHVCEFLSREIKASSDASALADPVVQEVKRSFSTAEVVG